MMPIPLVRFLILTLLLGQAAGDGLVIDPKGSPGMESGASSLPLDLSPLFNNKAFAKRPNDANFDKFGSGYPAQNLPDQDLTYQGIDFIFPQYSKKNDNIVAQGQKLDIRKGHYFRLSLLAAAENGSWNGFINATYSDGSRTSIPLSVGPWWAWPSILLPYQYPGDIIFPFRFTNDSADYNRSAIFKTTLWIDHSKELAAIHLPSNTMPFNRLHIFAMSLTCDSTNLLAVESARSTNKWLEGTNKSQIFEAQILNDGTKWVLKEQAVVVTVEGNGIRTVLPAHIHRLRIGDAITVQVGAEISRAVDGTVGNASLIISGGGIFVNYTFQATLGIREFEPTFEDTFKHETPSWFEDAKFGILIHWGLYSVPAWSNSGKDESFAEWYWWWMNEGPNSTIEHTYEYHLRTYGPTFTFDDFIEDYTAAAFDPKQWVDLIAEAGARYFVLTAKQYDGYDLFDIAPSVSRRTSIALKPHRHLLQELFDAAAANQPHLHKGTYYSLPEWFHPDYPGFGAWPGGNATNPYTNETLPYTGYVPIREKDFAAAKILPEMKALAAMGTEIMWCDIGGPNRSAEFAASFFNDAAKAGKQVSINNRCGIPGDFDTTPYKSTQVRKWEWVQSMDPRSFGYNKATADDRYMSPQTIIRTLVDVVSKNGNFLLNIGPRADGTIPDVMQRSLRTAGVWIESHAEAIFSTSYWTPTPEEGSVRFTVTADAFYIIALDAPNNTLTLRSPIPYIDGDQITIVGGNMSGEVVPSDFLDGALNIHCNETVRHADEYAWVFKILY